MFFNLTENRINIIFSEDGAYHPVVSEICNIVCEDVNILYWSRLKPKHKLKNWITKISVLSIEELKKNLFNIDWIVIDTISVNDEELINWLVNSGKTVIISTTSKSGWLGFFNKKFNDLTCFYYEASWDKPGNMFTKKDVESYNKSGLSMFGATSRDINNYYLTNLQTENKYSLEDWFDVEHRNRKLKKI